MEDLVPLLIFIVIAVVNLMKYLAEKGGKGKKAPAQPRPASPRTPHRSPSTLEEFFEEIAQKFEPKPTPLPDWPEGYERPDYMKEMEEFEQAPAKKSKAPYSAAAIPLPPKPTFTPMPQYASATEAPKARPPSKSGVFKLPAQEAVCRGMSGMLIPTPMLLRSDTEQIDFTLKGRKQLQQAIIASMVFGQPRAYDTSFDNTIAK